MTSPDKILTKESDAALPADALYKPDPDNILEVHNLSKHFDIKMGLFKSLPLKAVDDVSFFIKYKETLGLVGESGCGKTTVGRALMWLYPPTGGDVYFDGSRVSEKNVRSLRRNMQMVFQDPYSSLNPRMTVEDIIGESLSIHRVYKTNEERRARVHELMRLVGLNKEHATRYAHEFSGGQRQRIGIARALAINPKFIVCDESVSALDVSIQAQIINILMDLKEQKGLTYIFITHDLSVVKHISDEIAVMYLGQCVEKATSDELFANPKHPYTRALLAAIPVPNLSKRHKRPAVIRGEVGNPINPSPGCRFAPRCDYVRPECTGKNIELKDVGGGHFVACVLYDN